MPGMAENTIRNAVEMIPYLTPREGELGELVWEGYDNIEIARVLNLATTTVESLFNRLARSLGVLRPELSSRAMIVRAYSRYHKRP